MVLRSTRIKLLRRGHIRQFSLKDRLCLELSDEASSMLAPKDHNFILQNHLRIYHNDHVNWLLKIGKLRPPSRQTSHNQLEQSGFRLQFKQVKIKYNKISKKT